MTTSQMQAGLEAHIVRPVLIASLDIAGDPIKGWTGPGLFMPVGTGDTALDGNVFDPQEAPVEISDFVDNQGIGEAVTITMAAVDLDQDVIRQLIRDKRKYLGRRATIWFALLDETEAGVLPNPERLKTGVIVSMSMSRNKEQETIEIIIDEDLGGSRGGELRIIDHTKFWADDTFSSFVHKLVNRPGGIKGSVSSGGGGGGFSKYGDRFDGIGGAMQMR